jgi:hypothetical protein
MEVVPNLGFNNAPFLSSVPINILNWAQNEQTQSFPILNPLMPTPKVDYLPHTTITRKSRSSTPYKKPPCLESKEIVKKETKPDLADARNAAEFEMYRREKNRLVLGILYNLIFLDLLLKNADVKRKFK